jgi:hypothetical protein
MEMKKKWIKILENGQNSSHNDLKTFDYENKRLGFAKAINHY